MLDLSDRLVVIVGGGGVAARKARGLLEAGASRVRVVSPNVHEDMPAEVEHVRGEYEPGLLDGASLVFAATDRPDVNRAIVRDARQRNLWVNRADADDEFPGDFSSPATMREGELVITVSAGGSPALASAVRDELRGRLEPKWARMAAAMQALRPRILAGGAPIELRRGVFRDLASDEAMEVLARGGMDGLWAWLTDRHRASDPGANATGRER